MNATTLLCVVVFIVSALHQDAGAWKPKLTPEVDELIVQSGDELRIQCESLTERLQFSEQRIFHPRLRGDNFTIEYDGKSGTYTFIRPYAHRQHTGWYGCAKEGILIENDDQTIDHPSEDISWIYVYVNSTSPIAVIEANWAEISTVPNGRVVLPCRPTSPDQELDLRYSNSTIIPVGGNVSYDRKVGFILDHVDRSQDGVYYECAGRPEFDDFLVAGFVLKVKDE